MTRTLRVGFLASWFVVLYGCAGQIGDALEEEQTDDPLKGGRKRNAPDLGTVIPGPDLAAAPVDMSVPPTAADLSVPPAPVDMSAQILRLYFPNETGGCQTDRLELKVTPSSASFFLSEGKCFRIPSESSVAQLMVRCVDSLTSPTGLPPSDWVGPPMVNSGGSITCAEITPPPGL